MPCGVKLLRAPRDGGVTPRARLVARDGSAEGRVTAVGLQGFTAFGLKELEDIEFRAAQVSGFCDNVLCVQFIGIERSLLTTFECYLAILWKHAGRLFLVRCLNA